MWKQCIVSERDPIDGIRMTCLCLGKAFCRNNKIVVQHDSLL